MGVDFFGDARFESREFGVARGRDGGGGVGQNQQLFAVAFQVGDPVGAPQMFEFVFDGFAGLQRRQQFGVGIGIVGVEIGRGIFDVERVETFELID